MRDNTWHDDNNILRGYKSSIQEQYGTVCISEKELFNSDDFIHLTEHEYKVSHAIDLGWRYDVINKQWYRIKGF